MRACAVACRTGYARRRSGNRMNAERGRLGGWRALVAEVAANDVEGHYLQRVTRWRQPRRWCWARVNR